MYLNTDELMLLSRGGRVPPVARAGPRYRDWLAPHERESLTPRRSGTGLAVRGLMPARLRQVLGGGERGERQSARSPSMHGYADHDRYFEMEFAVGFGVEDEHWL